MSELIRQTGNDAIYAATNIILPAFWKGEKEILLKPEGGEGDIVTQVDKAAEAAMRRVLRQVFPTHCLALEELPIENPYAKKKWTGDPISATVNFAHGLYGFTTALAYSEEEEVLYGIVYEPLLKEVYSAQKGSGAFRKRDGKKDEKIRVSKTSLPREAVVFGATKGTGQRDDETRFYRDYFSNVIPKLSAVRRLGSQALEVCKVADGSVDAHFHYPPDPDSLAPAILILLEAGGKATDFQGRPWNRSSKTVITSNGTAIHDFLVEGLRGFEPSIVLQK